MSNYGDNSRGLSTVEAPFSGVFPMCLARESPDRPGAAGITHGDTLRLTGACGSPNMPVMDIWREMSSELERLADRSLLRRPVVVDSSCGPRVRIGDRDVVCLCSNDYLGLAGDPAVRMAAAEAIKRWGVGAGASRLICGTTSLHVELERRLAEFEGAEDAAVTPTGWMANHAAVCALVGKGDLVLCDKLDHASILDAARASEATMRTCPHRDVARLERLLEKHRRRHRRCLIVTDSLFSMDGDLAPLRELADVKRRFDAQLLIDEAHATGVLGDKGTGAAEMLGVKADIDATVGTLSKAIGALGGFVAAPRALIDTIRNTARPYMYTTAPPAAICAAAIESLGIIRDEPQRRVRLADLARSTRARLTDGGFDTRDSVSQIIPVVIGPEAAALGVSRRLLDEGFLVPAIRPPTVPRGTSRLRVSLCASHDTDDIERFIEVLFRAVGTAQM